MDGIIYSVILFLMDPEVCLSVVLGIVITIYGMTGLGRFYAYIPQIKPENDTMITIDMRQYILWLIGLILLFGYTIYITNVIWLSWIFVGELMLFVILFCVFLCDKDAYVKSQFGRLSGHKKKRF